MDYKFEFNGISTNGEPNKDLFVEMYNGTLLKNDTFTVELDDKDVELHTYIEDIDMAEYDSDSTDHIISIGVVPTFKSLSKKHQERILEQFMPEDRELLSNAALTHEGLLYGFGITLHSVTVKDLDKVEHTIDSAVAVHGAVEGLIGFDLDRYQNRIGSTGWDYLNDYCNDVDLVQVALGRYQS